MKEDFESEFKETLQIYTISFYKLCELFAEKHDLVYCEEYIDIDGPIYMSDYFLNIDDIIYDLENNIEVGVWEDWYDMNSELYEMGAKTCNYKSWCKGYRPYTPEQIEQLRQSQIRLSDIKKEFHDLIEAYKED